MARNVVFGRQRAWQLLFLAILLGPALAQAQPVGSQERTAASSFDRDRYAATVGGTDAEQGLQRSSSVILLPASFGDVQNTGNLSAAAVSAPLGSAAESSSAPRTASTVASTLALILFFFLRRVQ